MVYKATGVGTMDIEIYDQMISNYDYRNCEFIQIPLSEDMEYSQKINNELITSSENYKITSNKGAVINVTKEQDLYKTTPITETSTITPKPTTSPVKKPSTPKLSKTSVTNNAITIKWNKVSNITGYQVYRKINSGKWKSVKTTTGTSYKDTNVKAGYKYSYTVKAYKTTNGKKVYSAYNKKGLSGKLNTNISVSAKNQTVTVSWKKKS